MALATTTATGATYTNKTGTSVTPYQDSNGNIGTVLAGSVFDPNSSNYNAKIAGSNGTINLGNQSNYDSSGNYVGNNSGSSALRATVQGSSSPSNSTYSSYVAPTTTDNSSLISSQYDQALAASQAALKASIQQSMGTYQDTIAKAPTTYQPLRDQASAAGASNSQNLQEMLANNGQQGGVNRTESTAVNSATENNINNLNTQQQGVIDTANKAIADLQAQGDIKGAQLVADNASAKLSALIAESNRVDSTTYSRGQDALNNGINIAGLTGTYNGQSTLAGQSLKNTIEQQNTDNTGYTANGTQTIAGKMADANIESTKVKTALDSANLKEMVDPNSTTNQLKQLGLNTAKLNYAALPTQLQLQADKLKQDLATGNITQQAAQLQLNNLPQQQLDAHNQTVAQTAATGRSNTGSSSSAATAKATATAQKTDATNSAYTEFYNQLDTGNAPQWLVDYRGDLINAIGASEYSKMVAQANASNQNAIKNNTTSAYYKEGQYR